MSWSIEERIGEFRPFPAQVVVYKGNTDECLAYVSGEVADRLKAENAKLRELVWDAYTYYYAAYYSGVGVEDIDKQNIEELEQRMRELGVEV